MASSSGSDDYDAHDAARFRLAWALAHSKRPGDAARGVLLLEEGRHRWGDKVQVRDRHYITAVAHFNDGDYLAARVAAEAALRLDAGCRQAEALKAAVEDKIAKDGLIGIGALGVGAAVLGGVLSALASSSRRR